MGLPVLFGVAGKLSQMVLTEQVGKVLQLENSNQLVELLIDLEDDSSGINGCRKMKLMQLRGTIDCILSLQTLVGMWTL